MRVKTSIISTAVGLTALLGCQQVDQQVDRVEQLDGYKLIQHQPYISFQHDSVHNVDEVYFGKTGELYTDYHCDGHVDTIAAQRLYSKLEPGTEKIFEEADKTLLQVKREFGVQ